MINSLNSSKASERQEALKQFESGDPQITDDVIAQVKTMALGDSNENVKNEAVRAYGRIAGAASIPTLGEIAAGTEKLFIRKSAISALGATGNSEALKQIVTAVKNDKSAEQDISSDGIRAIRTIGGDKAGEALIDIYGSKRKVELQTEIIYLLGELNVKDAAPLVRDALLKSTDERQRTAAATALIKILGVDSLKTLDTVLSQELVPRVRNRIITEMRGIVDAQRIPLLCRTVLLDPSAEVRAEAIALLENIPQWDQKTNAFLSYIKSLWVLTRGQIDDKAVVRAMQPPAAMRATNPNQLAEYLLNQWPGQDERVVSIISMLYTECCDQDQNRAGKLLDEYEKRAQADYEKAKANDKNAKLPFEPEELLRLRILVGGQTALASVIAQLEYNLKVNFQEPIKKLNDETLLRWKQTVDRARFGFWIRMAMSVIIFIIGLLLVGVSASRLFSIPLSSVSAPTTSQNGGSTTSQNGAQATPEATPGVGEAAPSTSGSSPTTTQPQDQFIELFFGAGVPFLSGLITLILVTYSGPMRDISRSVREVSQANAALIGFIHRVLQVSHYYIYVTVKQQMSIDQIDKMKEMTGMIGSAMTDFNTALGDSPDDSLAVLTANLEKIQSLISKKEKA